MAYEAEFIGWAEVTGDSSEGAIVRLSAADEHILSAVVRVSRTLMKIESMTSSDLRDRLPNIAVRQVLQHAEADPAWIEKHRGELDVPFMIDHSGSLT
jgi:hypothetical protein